MEEIELPAEDRLDQQRTERLVRDEDVVALLGAGIAIRFPAGWARKLPPWYDGPGRNILCNADAERYNLVGITKDGEDLLLSFVGTDGELRSERASGGFVRHLAPLLEAEEG